MTNCRVLHSFFAGAAMLALMAGAVSAKPAGGPSAGSPGLQAASPGRPAGAPGRFVGRSSHGGAHGHFRPGRRFAGGPGLIDPVFYNSAIQGPVYPEQFGGRIEIEIQRSIPVAVGIARPPQASPVIYRIEGGKGRTVARVIRIDDAGSEVVSQARVVRVGSR